MMKRLCSLVCNHVLLWFKFKCKASYSMPSFWILLLLLFFYILLCLATKLLIKLNNLILLLFFLHFSFFYLYFFDKVSSFRIWKFKSAMFYLVCGVCFSYFLFVFYLFFFIKFWRLCRWIIITKKNSKISLEC
jgi:hypothetical protein